MNNARKPCIATVFGHFLFCIVPKSYQFTLSACYHNTYSVSISAISVCFGKQLKIVCDFLEYNGISTHSFRKYYATEIYKNNGYNIALVQQLLQHSSTAVTQRYIGIQQKEIETAIENHLKLDI